MLAVWVDLRLTTSTSPERFMAAKKAKRAKRPRSASSTKGGKEARAASPTSRARGNVSVRYDEDEAIHALSSTTGEPPPRASKTLERVRYIADEMSAGRWDGYATRVPLAEVWGVTDSRVRDYAAEAHRLIAADPQELLERRRSFAGWAALQRQRASSMVNQQTGLPDFGNAVKVAEFEAKCIGLDLEPEKKAEAHEPVAMRVEVTVAPDPPAPASPPATSGGSAQSPATVHPTPC
jgi:hypothetical protein